MDKPSGKTDSSPRAGRAQKSTSAAEVTIELKKSGNFFMALYAIG